MWTHPSKARQKVFEKILQLTDNRKQRVSWEKAQPRLGSSRLRARARVCWRKQYGGMGTDQRKERKQLQQENEQLRKAVSDPTRDKLILTEATRRNF